MANEKFLKGRFQQKTDTKRNWDKAVNFVPLDGEIIIYKDLNKFKIGDGVTKVGELNFSPDGIIERNNETDSIVFNDPENSAALGDYSISFGHKSIAGSKGYYIAAIDYSNGYIYLQKDGITVKPNYENFENFYDANFNTGYDINGDLEFSVSSNVYYHWPFLGKITEISGNRLKYQATFADESKKYWINDTDRELQPFVFYIPRQYEHGPVSIGVGAIAEGWNTYASGDHSHAEGWETMAAGRYAHAEGDNTKAGFAAHAEGEETFALGLSAHAEGYKTVAHSDYSHASGLRTTAYGYASHAEGLSSTLAYKDIKNESAETVLQKWEDETTDKFTIAFGTASHVEGTDNLALGINSHSEGNANRALGNQSHAEGKNNTAQGIHSHAEGRETQAKNEASHAEGVQTIASGYASHAEGEGTQALASNSHVEGAKNLVNNGAYNAHAEGAKNVVGLANIAYSGVNAHAEGSQNTVTGQSAHAEGDQNTVTGQFAHAEGSQNTVIGQSAHIEGFSATIAPETDTLTSWETNKNFSYAEGKASHVEGQNNYAQGEASHAEGINTLAKGARSHAEGSLTQATNYHSHAEGVRSIASGVAAHAEGKENNAKGQASHAEGEYTTAQGTDSHAEGKATRAKGAYTHAEGSGATATVDGKVITAFENAGLTDSSSVVDIENAWNAITDENKKFAAAVGDNSHSEGFGTLALANQSHAEGKATKASKFHAHAEGRATVANGEASHAEGYGSRAEGDYSHAEGKGTANGVYSHAEGLSTASGNYSHTEGYSTYAYGECSHAEGYNATAQGIYSHAEGFKTQAYAAYSHAEGYGTYTRNYGSHAEGRWNTKDGSYAHVVGNGSSDTNRSNAHTLDWQGNAWFQGAVTSSGADYAEFFEWKDGNPDAEDRVGRAVTLHGDKIAFANVGDPLLGIISGTAAVLGDNAECAWKNKFLTDKFGRIIYDQVEEFHTEIDPKTQEEKKISLGFFPRPRLNPDYDPNEAYISREDRPEWDKVGMFGKLYALDDGSCVAGGYAMVGINGALTYSSEPTNMYVMKRTAEDVIYILLK